MRKYISLILLVGVLSVSDAKKRPLIYGFFDEIQAGRELNLENPAERALLRLYLGRHSISTSTGPLSLDERLNQLKIVLGSDELNPKLRFPTWQFRSGKSNLRLRAFHA